jgi:pyruvate kinase
MDQDTGFASRLNSSEFSMRRAKIVCTLGPASNSEPMIRELMRAGMDVARLNFSHGTHEEHGRTMERIRRAAQKENRTICIMQDLQGPKMRTGRLRYRTPVALKRGSRVTVTPREVAGTNTLIPTTVPTLAQDVEPGTQILLSDGLIELRVLGVRGADVECEVVDGGILHEHQGINLPGKLLSLPSLTEKDVDDLEFGMRRGVDVVAVSFVRRAEDVRVARRIIERRGLDLPIIAKLEKPQAIDHLEEIMDAASGVMVARGDLGVEVAPEKVPVMQKLIIRRARAWRKPVITATQMLESMMENPRPTRAEASDVANAIFDGSDAVMLSGETASGKYPREAVAMMARIISEAEEHREDDFTQRRRRARQRPLSISETICESVANAACELDMRAIAVYTETGATARLISKYRPPTGIYAFTKSASVCNRMNLYWGVQPREWSHGSTPDEMVVGAEKRLLAEEVIRPGDVVGVVSGTQMHSGATNLMRLHQVPLPTKRDRRKSSRQRPRE